MYKCLSTNLIKPLTEPIYMKLDTKAVQKRVVKALNTFIKDKKEIKVKEQWFALKNPAFFADIMELEGRYAVNVILQFLDTPQKPMVLFTIPIKVNETTFQIGANEIKTQKEVEDTCEKAALHFANLNFR